MTCPRIPISLISSSLSRVTTIAICLFLIVLGECAGVISSALYLVPKTLVYIGFKVISFDVFLFLIVLG
jgi:hypothetical protein